MWRFLSALFLTPAAFAQQDFLAEYYAQALAEYLRVSPEQVEQLLRNRQEYETATATQRKETNRLNDEIGKETQKPDPAVPVLGSLYAQIEDLCRREQPPRRALHERQLRVLTAEQREGLAALQAAPLREGLYNAATYRFLLDPSVSTGTERIFNGTSYQAEFYFYIPDLAPFAKLSPPLIDYLQLTPAQAQSIERRLTEYVDELTAQRLRMVETSSAAERALRGTPPEPQAIGRSYRELEAIRRQLAAREDRLRRENLETLTEPQRQRLSELKPVRPPWQTAYLVAMELTLIEPFAGTPASRESYPVAIITDPLGSTSGSGSSGTLLFVATPVDDTGLPPSPIRSIYRACAGGPEYTLEIVLSFSGSRAGTSRYARTGYDASGSAGHHRPHLALH